MVQANYIDKIISWELGGNFWYNHNLILEFI